MVEKPADNINKVVDSNARTEAEGCNTREVVAVNEEALPEILDAEKSEESALEKVLKESQENRDKWLRSVAELENYKKRSIQERSRLLKYKEEDLLRDLLPVVDNLERALSSSHKKTATDPLTQGIKMVLGMFIETLKKYGVVEIEAIGKNFDPQFHEAIAQETTEHGPSNEVTKELEKGYMYKDRLLRPAKVVVSKAAK